MRSRSLVTVAAANFARACVIFARNGEGASQEQMIEWMEKTAEQTTRAIDIVVRLGTFVKKDAGIRTSFANAPQTRFLRIDDSNHFIQIDQAARFVAEVDAFMR